MLNLFISIFYVFCLDTGMAKSSDCKKCKHLSRAHWLGPKAFHLGLGHAILFVILRRYICRRESQREFTPHCEISEVKVR